MSASLIPEPYTWCACGCGRAVTCDGWSPWFATEICHEVWAAKQRLAERERRGDPDWW